METNTLLIIVFVVSVIVFRFIVPVIRRSDTGSFMPRQYDVSGGAVCPRCELPYSRKTLSPNHLFGKLERCPHCGKIAVVRRATVATLEAAEARLAADNQIDPPQSAQTQSEERRQQLEDSRFVDYVPIIRTKIKCQLTFSLN